ncbi:MAG: carbon storage regulator CsrA [Planctomycetota bacterium]|nr:carbon storage regulator CsrA [Planctomycetota bacterium]MDA1162062.1 carbon storage regulator CsrA [Planctomycetota bacterium]
MLVLSRKKDEKIVIGDNISIMVVEIRGDKVRLGIDAPRDVSVHRREVYEAIKRKETEQSVVEEDATEDLSAVESADQVQA